MSQFASRLRQHRLERGLAQERLAQLAGISVGTVGRIEAGRHTPTMATAQRLADALGVPLSILVADDDEPLTEPTARPA